MLAGLQFFVPLRMEPLRPLAGRDPRRRRGARRGRGGAGCGGPRGPRRLPARLHGHPADRLPLAGPLGVVGPGLYDVIKVVTDLFPFKPALEAMTAALDSAGPGIGPPLLHLAILIVAYGLIARLCLRRFAAV